MTVIIDSTAEIDGVRLREQGGDPSAPSASHWLLYAKAAGLFIEDSAASVTGPFGSGGGGSGEAIIKSLTNMTGGGVVVGDVVVVSFDDPASFQLASITPQGANQMIAVVTDASIANGADGNVCLAGYVSRVNLTATPPVLAAFICLSGTSKKGVGRGANSTASFTPDAGDFAIALDTDDDHPAAILFGGFPIQPVERRLGTFSAVNLNTGTDQSLYLCSSSRSCVVTKFVVRNASTSLTTASFSIGWTSAAYNDLLANATHVELTGSTLFTVLPVKAGAAIGAADAQMKLKNNTLQGSAATVTIEVFGYLF